MTAKFSPEQQELAAELARNGWKPTLLGHEWISSSGLFRVKFIGDGTTVLQNPVWTSRGKPTPPAELACGMRAVGVLLT